jgi:anti-sigma factor RsiW
MMEHEDAMELLSAYLDQELGIPDLVAIEQHIKGCAICQNEFSALSGASNLLKKHAAYFVAPDRLSQRLANNFPQSPTASRYKNWNLNWLNAGALLATVLALTWSSELYLTLPSAQDQLVQELISSHVRSLQVDHLSDVVSSDRHTVKPWFNGKLDFSPPVTDLSSNGFPLVGGRLDYINGHNVAVMTYRHNQHPINLYVWPSSANEEVMKKWEHQGYHLLRWGSGGFEYWVVSELASAELETFVVNLRAPE